MAALKIPSSRFKINLNPMPATCLKPICALVQGGFLASLFIHRTRLAVGARLRQFGRVNNASFADAVLVVLGHGTDLNDQSAIPVRQHASELRRRRVFAAVREAFWKQEPQIKKVLAELSAPRVFIAPLFISEGYFAGEVIPKELGFGESRTINNQLSTINYCRPVGSHESMTKVILSRAAQITKQFPFPRAPKPAETTLFIAGHGTEKNVNSRKAIEHQADLIRAQQIYADVHTVFMEEEPRIAGCHLLAHTKNCVVVPFFISDGLHVVEDIPVLLGEPERIVKARLAAGQPTWRNPTEKHGKLFWYSSSVGTEPGLADVILERVSEACRVNDE
jgi:sirohydrochlorin cobaltochelatase